MKPAIDELHKCRDHEAHCAYLLRQPLAGGEGLKTGARETGRETGVRVAGGGFEDEQPQCVQYWPFRAVHFHEPPTEQQPRYDDTAHKRESNGHVPPPDGGDGWGLVTGALVDRTGAPVGVGRRTGALVDRTGARVDGVDGVGRPGLHTAHVTGHLPLIIWPCAECVQYGASWRQEASAPLRVMPVRVASTQLPENTGGEVGGGVSNGGEVPPEAQLLTIWLDTCSRRFGVFFASLILLGVAVHLR